MNVLQVILLVVTVAIAAAATGFMWLIFGPFGGILTGVLSLVSTVVALYLTGALSGTGGSDNGSQRSYESKGARED